MAKPVCSRGASAATSALAAATVPVTRPCTARRMINSSEERAKPIRPSITAPPSVARTTITLRPCRSASAPQMGAASIIVNAWTEITSPESTSTLVPVVLPSSLRYRGKNGKMVEKPTAENNCARKTMSSVFCQRSSLRSRLITCLLAPVNQRSERAAPWCVCQRDYTGFGWEGDIVTGVRPEI